MVALPMPKNYERETHKPETDSMTVRRLKTYAGSQGYVYQYYFVGQRPTADQQATEYVFDVTRDRQTVRPLSVFLSKSSVAAWNQAHGRALSDTEQFAAVKLRLFRAFDEIENIEGSGLQIKVEPGFLDEALAKLGIT